MKSTEQVPVLSYGYSPFTPSLSTYGVAATRTIILASVEGFQIVDVVISDSGVVSIRPPALTK